MTTPRRYEALEELGDDDLDRCRRRCLESGKSLQELAQNGRLALQLLEKYKPMDDDPEPEN